MLWTTCLAMGAQAVLWAAPVPAKVEPPATASYSLVDVSVREAAMAVSHHTGLPVAMEGAVKGLVTLVSQGELDRLEALALFVRVVDEQGWEIDFDTQCRLHLKGRPAFLEAFQTRARMYRVSGMTAAEAAGLVRPLLSPQGQLGTPDNQRLLVVDTPGAHLRVLLLSMHMSDGGKAIGTCGLPPAPAAHSPSEMAEAWVPRLRFTRSLLP